MFKGRGKFQARLSTQKTGPMDNVNTNIFIIYVQKREDDIIQRK